MEVPAQVAQQEVAPVQVRLVGPQHPEPLCVWTTHFRAEELLSKTVEQAWVLLVHSIASLGVATCEALGMGVPVQVLGLLAGQSRVTLQGDTGSHPLSQYYNPVRDGPLLCFVRAADGPPHAGPLVNGSGPGMESGRFTTQFRGAALATKEALGKATLAVQNTFASRRQQGQPADSVFIDVEQTKATPPWQLPVTKADTDVTAFSKQDDPNTGCFAGHSCGMDSEAVLKLRRSRAAQASKAAASKAAKVLKHPALREATINIVNPKLKLYDKSLTLAVIVGLMTILATGLITWGIHNNCDKISTFLPTAELLKVRNTKGVTGTKCSTLEDYSLRSFIPDDARLPYTDVRVSLYDPDAAYLLSTFKASNFKLMSNLLRNTVEATLHGDQAFVRFAQRAAAGVGVLSNTAATAAKEAVDAARGRLKQLSDRIGAVKIVKELQPELLQKVRNLVVCNNTRPCATATLAAPSPSSPLLTPDSLAVEYLPAGIVWRWDYASSGATSPSTGSNGGSVGGWLDGPMGIVDYGGDGYDGDYEGQTTDAYDYTVRFKPNAVGRNDDFSVYAGVVQVAIGGTWGPICNDGSFGDKEALVICKQLTTYHSYLQGSYVTGAEVYSQDDIVKQGWGTDQGGEGLVRMQNLWCYDYMDNLAQCYSNVDPASITCSRSRAAGVLCRFGVAGGFPPFPPGRAPPSPPPSPPRPPPAPPTTASRVQTAPKWDARITQQYVKSFIITDQKEFNLLAGNSLAQAIQGGGDFSGSNSRTSGISTSLGSVDFPESKRKNRGMNFTVAVKLGVRSETDPNVRARGYWLEEIKVILSNLTVTSGPSEAFRNNPTAQVLGLTKERTWGLREQSCSIKVDLRKDGELSQEQIKRDGDKGTTGPDLLNVAVMVGTTQCCQVLGDRAPNKVCVVREEVLDKAAYELIAADPPQWQDFRKRYNRSPDGARYTTPSAAYGIASFGEQTRNPELIVAWAMDYFASISDDIASRLAMAATATATPSSSSGGSGGSGSGRTNTDPGSTDALMGSGNVGAAVTAAGIRNFKPTSLSAAIKNAMYITGLFCTSTVCPPVLGALGSALGYMVWVEAAACLIALAVYVGVRRNERSKWKYVTMTAFEALIAPSEPPSAASTKPPAAAEGPAGGSDSSQAEGNDKLGDGEHGNGGKGGNSKLNDADDDAEQQASSPTGTPTEEMEEVDNEDVEVDLQGPADAAGGGDNANTAGSGIRITVDAGAPTPPRR